MNACEIRLKSYIKSYNEKWQEVRTVSFKSPSNMPLQKHFFTIFSVLTAQCTVIIIKILIYFRDQSVCLKLDFRVIGDVIVYCISLQSLL